MLGNCIICERDIHGQAVDLAVGALVEDGEGGIEFDSDHFDDGEENKDMHLECVRELFSYARIQGRCGSCGTPVNKDLVQDHCPRCDQDPHRSPVEDNLQCPYCTGEGRDLFLEDVVYAFQVGSHTVYVCQMCVEYHIGDDGDETVAERRLGTGPYA